MTEPNLPHVLSAPEVADFLRIGRNNAYDLIRSGKLHCVRIGRSIRVPRQAVLDFLVEYCK